MIALHTACWRSMKTCTNKALFVTLLFSLSFGIAEAQYHTNQNKVWGFGNRGGIDFTSGSPVPFFSWVSTGEGCATVCNAAGTLLFVTDGYNVRNASGSIMPNGSFIAGLATTSSSQACAIVPVLSNPNRYYIFTMEQASASAGYCHLAYSIVDMTLDGGNGDVMTAFHGLPMANRMSEKMTTVKGDSCNVWLITHRKDSATFWVYNITSSGISAPVISHVGSLSGADVYAQGLIKVSHDRQKLVAQMYGSGVGTELYDFNPLTGVVSNCRVLNSTTARYSAEFSADNTKLYVDAYNGGTISQYDLSLSTTSAIIASLTTVGTATSGYGDLKLAPDGKIYISKTGNRMDRIDNPNGLGSLCSFASNAITLFAGSVCNYGLPATVCIPFSSVAGPITGADTVCIGDTIVLSDTSFGGQWISSSPAIASVGSYSGMVVGSSAGVATVRYIVNNGCNADTASHVVTVSNCALSASLAEDSGPGLAISPNPSSGSFSIRFSSPYDEEVLVVIVNALGQKTGEVPVMTNTEERVSLQLAPGIYFLKAITKRGTLAAKLVINY